MGLMQRAAQLRWADLTNHAPPCCLQPKPSPEWLDAGVMSRMPESVFSTNRGQLVLPNMVSRQSPLPQRCPDHIAWCSFGDCYT